jgi:hypothetical protein
MKTNCEFFDECRRPVECCTSKCPDYVKRKNASGSKLADANVGEQKADSSRSRKE